MSLIIVIFIFVHSGEWIGNGTGMQRSWNGVKRTKLNNKLVFEREPILLVVEVELLHGGAGTDAERTVILDLDHGDAVPPVLLLLAAGEEFWCARFERAECFLDGTDGIEPNEFSCLQPFGDGGKGMFLLRR